MGQMKNREATLEDSPDAACVTLAKRHGVWGVPTSVNRVSDILAPAILQMLCDNRSLPKLGEAQRPNPRGDERGKSIKPL